MYFSSSHRRSAFTIIELLVATLLAALLLSALVGVLRTLEAERRLLDERGLPEPWKRQLVEQLRWDLLNARHMTIRASQLRLIGFASRDPVTGAATQQPSDIRYSIQHAGQQPWLVREELLATSERRRELVCSGVAAIDLRSAADDEQSPIADARQVHADGTPRFPPTLVKLPTQCRVLLYQDAGQHAWLNEVVVRGADR